MHDVSSPLPWPQLCAASSYTHHTSPVYPPQRAISVRSFFPSPSLPLARSIVRPSHIHSLSLSHTETAHLFPDLPPHTSTTTKQGLLSLGGEEKEKAAPRREMERLEHLLSTSYIDLELFWHPLLKCIVWNFLDSVAYSGTGLHLRVQGWLGLVGLLLQLCLAAQRMASPLFRARL